MQDVSCEIHVKYCFYIYLLSRMVHVCVGWVCCEIYIFTITCGTKVWKLIPRGKYFPLVQFPAIENRNLANRNSLSSVNAGCIGGIFDISKSEADLLFWRQIQVWLACTHVGSVLLKCLLQDILVELTLNSRLSQNGTLFTMSSSFFIKTKEKPKIAKMGRNAAALKRNVSEMDC